MISCATARRPFRLLRCWASAPALALAAAKTRIEVQDVNGLALLTGGGGNVVALPSAEGALLVDGGLAAHSSEVLKAVASATGSKRVATLINTHWHPEQTGSNETVGKAGGNIISHEVTRLALSRKNPSALYTGTYGALPQRRCRPRPPTTRARYSSRASRWTTATCRPRTPTATCMCTSRSTTSSWRAARWRASSWPVIDWLNGGFYHGFLRSYEILSEVVKPDTVVIGAQGVPLTGSDIVRHKDVYWALFKQFFILFNKGFGPRTWWSSTRARSSSG